MRHNHNGADVWKLYPHSTNHNCVIRSKRSKLNNCKIFLEQDKTSPWWYCNLSKPNVSSTSYIVLSTSSVTLGNLFSHNNLLHFKRKKKTYMHKYLLLWSEKVRTQELQVWILLFSPEKSVNFKKKLYKNLLYIKIMDLIKKLIPKIK